MMPRKPLGNDTQLLRAETNPAGEASSVKVKKAGKKE
jgi:hypothetical protein